MPEFLPVDEMPGGVDPDAAELGSIDGKIQCPECDKMFQPSGLKRHITMSHRGGVSEAGTSSAPKGNSKARVNIESRWADFQRGAAMLVSLACVQCAAALSEDAANDGKALAQFCEHRPKLRKQVEDFLSTADFILLVGAFGGTAQKMIGHHSIGKRIPGISTTPNTGHATHDPAERMMTFMGGLPPEQRHQMMDQVFEAQKHAADVQRQAQAAESYESPGAGAEPTPNVETLTEHDAQLRAAMSGGALV